MGSDDGIIKILRDAADSDTINLRSKESVYPSDWSIPSNEYIFPANNDHPFDVNSKNIYVGGMGEEPCGVTVASSFVALPDIADTTQGSGLVTSWLQRTGTLVVGGNSSSIHVWDISREQCVRTFSTGK